MRPATKWCCRKFLPITGLYKLNYYSSTVAKLVAEEGAQLLSENWQTPAPIEFHNSSGGQLQELLWCILHYHIYFTIYAKYEWVAPPGFFSPVGQSWWLCDSDEMLIMSQLLNLWMMEILADTHWGGFMQWKSFVLCLLVSIVDPGSHEHFVDMGGTKKPDPIKANCLLQPHWTILNISKKSTRWWACAGNCCRQWRKYHFSCGVLSLYSLW